TARKATIKTGGTMMNANHAITSATVSSVSPWRNEAWARDGSARNVKVMNRTKCLQQGRRDLPWERMSDSLVFMVYQFTFSAVGLSRNSSRTKVIVIAFPAAFAAQYQNPTPS